MGKGRGSHGISNCLSLENKAPTIFKMTEASRENKLLTHMRDLAEQIQKNNVKYQWKLI